MTDGFTNDVLVILAIDGDVAADYACHVATRPRDVVFIGRPSGANQVNVAAETLELGRFDPTDFVTRYAARTLAGVVVFAKRSLRRSEQTAFTKVAAALRELPACPITIVATCQSHFDDRRAERTEQWIANLFDCKGRPPSVIRTGHVLSPSSTLLRWLRRLAFCHVLTPEYLRSGCVDHVELFRVIDQTIDRRETVRRPLVTLLGPNRPWQDWLREQQRTSTPTGLTWCVYVLKYLLIGRLLAGCLSLVVACFPRLRHWHYHAIRPRDARELLALCDVRNSRHVRVVGYNNGVVHFGRQYPGKTVVSTCRAARRLRLKGNLLTVDGGITVAQAVAFLRSRGKEFPVVPNYSFVALGTAFFVPIHGSAAACGTIGETIEHVLLYDATLDTFVRARRDDPAFVEYIYNLERDVVLLRLTLRVTDRARYLVHRATRATADADEIIRELNDRAASNIEIRKSRASTTSVQICKYYVDHGPEGVELTETPRDAVGKVWDRIERTPLLSAAFHTLVRTCGYHVELFLTPDEFALFWTTHRHLPLAKIQIRRVHRDGFPHSPFRDGDRIAIDLFMWRKHRSAFRDYLSQNLPMARINVGKHGL